MAQAMHIHKNDTVVVTSGNSSGKQGKVLKVFPATRQVIIENVNIIKRHTKANQKNPQGGILQKEGPIQAANVMVVCPKCSAPTRVGHTHISDATSGKRRTMRVCKQCNEMF